MAKRSPNKSGGAFRLFMGFDVRYLQDFDPAVGNRCSLEVSFVCGLNCLFYMLT